VVLSWTIIAIAVMCVLCCWSGPALAADDWVREPPAAETQFEKTVEERGGVHPCDTPDPGFGTYHPWNATLSTGQVLVPRQLRADGVFDLVIHFHGHEAARKEWVRVARQVVFVGIDRGVGSSAYAGAFPDDASFEGFLEEVRRIVGETSGVAEPRLRFLGLSAWSAGYAAVRDLLRTDSARRRVDSVILLDAIHAGYRNSAIDELGLAPFVWLANEAAQGRRFLFVSHSSIVPPGYASTTETARYLMAQLGVRPIATQPRGTDPMGLDLISYYVGASFHVRGYAGNGKMDHCAQLGLLGDVMRVHVSRRWHAR
jgi:hypothetical protein